jgi:D-xylose 1-dehydrogenase (NADP+, D-xylono-1,5-lactone-forming)
MPERLRWGLLSTGNINRAVIPPLRASQRNELTAVASRDGERARAYAQTWGIPHTFDSYDALLADPDIDVVYISLPNSLHAPWAVRAAQAGKHVLCEKPMGLTAAQVDEIAAAARRANVVVMEAFMYRHHWQTLKVKELVDGGAIGKVRLIRGSFSFQIASEEDVRLSAPLDGGSVWDVGCYPISYIRHLLGQEPIEVFGWQMTGAHGVDEMFAGQMRFPGDVYGQFDCGFRVPHRQQLEVVGSEGIIRVPVPFKPETHSQIWLQRGDAEPEAINLESPELYTGEIEDMADCILTGKAPRVSIADSRGNAATIAALLASASEGKPIVP